MSTVPRFWSLSFLDNRGLPKSSSESFWFDLFISEPALIEASVAIGEKFWSPNVASKRRASTHSNMAINTVIQRIQSREAQTDGILGAVTTMAFGERLTRNDTAWNVHIDGVAQIIKERHAQGIFTLPPWFLDLQILSAPSSLSLLVSVTNNSSSDSINEILGFPRMYHRKIIDALGDHGGPVLSKVASISNRVIQLRKSIDVYRRHQLLIPSTVIAEKEIEEMVAALCREARALCVGEENPSVQATSISIELVLRLSWPPLPPSQSDVDFAPLVSGLKKALCQLEIRPCAYMELTSYQFMLGAIAAAKGSPTRAWYVARLKRVVQAMGMRGWAEPLQILERGGFLSDPILMELFNTLCIEILS